MTGLSLTGGTWYDAVDAVFLSMADPAATNPYEFDNDAPTADNIPAQSLPIADFSPVGLADASGGDSGGGTPVYADEMPAPSELASPSPYAGDELTMPCVGNGGQGGLIPCMADLDDPDGILGPSPGLPLLPEGVSPPPRYPILIAPSSTNGPMYIIEGPSGNDSTTPSGGTESAFESNISPPSVVPLIPVQPNPPRGNAVPPNAVVPHIIQPNPAPQGVVPGNRLPLVAGTYH